VFATNDGGQSWKVISPDLSRQDPSRIMPSGGMVGDNLGQFYGEVVFAIAPSPVQKGLIWAGTNDGKVWYTRDGGGRWNDVTRNISGLPAWSVVSKIDPSNFEAGTAYVAVDAHLIDKRDPFIFKTTDFGQTWTRVTGDLPSKHPLDYVLSVAENQTGAACCSPEPAARSTTPSMTARTGRPCRTGFRRRRCRGSSYRSSITTLSYRRTAAASTSSMMSRRSSRLIRPRPQPKRVCSCPGQESQSSVPGRQSQSSVESSGSIVSRRLP
jgi:hypothetical protein